MGRKSSIRSTRTQQQTQEVLNMQIAVLKKKNTDLAKRLAEKELECGHATQMALQQQNALVQKDMTIALYREKFKRILNSISVSSIHMTNIAEECTDLMPDILQSQKASMNTNADQTPVNRTQMVVKPMVGGHTIFRPTIKLSRVSNEELVRLMNTNGNGDVDDEEDQMDDDAQEEQADTEPSEENNRLVTLNEEEEYSSFEGLNVQPQQSENSVTPSNSVPLLSGVFKDVKVYISPIRGTALNNNSTVSLRASTSFVQDNSSPTVRGKNLPVNTARLSQTSLGTQTITASICAPSTSFDHSTESSHAAQGDVKNFVCTQRPSKKVRVSLPDSTTCCSADIDNSYQMEILNAQEDKQSTDPEDDDDDDYADNSTKQQADSDPLEGPSHLLDSTANGLNHSDVMGCLSMVGVGDRLINNTSTPYTPMEKGRKRSIDQVTENKENTLVPETPMYLTKRRQKKSQIQNLIRKSKEFPHCTVVLERMPSNSSAGILTATCNGSINTNNQNYNDGYASTGSNSSNSCLESGRPRRSKAPVSLKEMSLRKKLRRSK